ncbi:hypothetical protein ACFQL0_00775 [Haloplanus litoreus]|uniref:hypothetical protein n=1 Tax=Haloplanus litoreus TaxID=767515 RepID=UPI00361E2D09
MRHRRPPAVGRLDGVGRPRRVGEEAGVGRETSVAEAGQPTPQRVEPPGRRGRDRPPVELRKVDVLDRRERQGELVGGADGGVEAVRVPGEGPVEQDAPGASCGPRRSGRASNVRQTRSVPGGRWTGTRASVSNRRFRSVSDDRERVNSVTSWTDWSASQTCRQTASAPPRPSSVLWRTATRAMPVLRRGPS